MESLMKTNRIQEEKEHCEQGYVPTKASSASGTAAGGGGGATATETPAAGLAERFSQGRGDCVGVITTDGSRNLRGSGGSSGLHPQQAQQPADKYIPPYLRAGSALASRTTMMHRDAPSDTHSVSSRATSAYTVEATHHLNERKQERGISIKELQKTVKNGRNTRKVANAGPRGEKRWRYEHEGIVYITDESSKVGVTCWKNVSTYPKASSEHEKALIRACMKQDLATAREMIEVHNVSPNITCNRGSTPLMWACPGTNQDEKDVSLLTYLLTIPGIDIDYPSANMGRSALHWCVARASSVAVPLLIAAGATLSVHDNDNKTPLEQVYATASNVASSGLSLEERREVMERALEAAEFSARERDGDGKSDSDSDSNGGGGGDKY